MRSESNYPQIPVYKTPETEAKDLFAQMQEKMAIIQEYPPAFRELRAAQFHISRFEEVLKEADNDVNGNELNRPSFTVIYVCSRTANFLFLDIQRCYEKFKTITEKFQKLEPLVKNIPEYETRLKTIQQHFYDKNSEISLNEIRSLLYVLEDEIQTTSTRNIQRERTNTQMSLHTATNPLNKEMKQEEPQTKKEVTKDNQEERREKYTIPVSDVSPTPQKESSEKAQAETFDSTYHQKKLYKVQDKLIKKIKEIEAARKNKNGKKKKKNTSDNKDVYDMKRRSILEALSILESRVNALKAPIREGNASAISLQNTVLGALRKNCRLCKNCNTIESAIIAIRSGY